VATTSGRTTAVNRPLDACGRVDIPVSNLAESQGGGNHTDPRSQGREKTDQNGLDENCGVLKHTNGSYRSAAISLGEIRPVPP
jgi:hypothetical protein